MEGRTEVTDAHESNPRFFALKLYPFFPMAFQHQATIPAGRGALITHTIPPRGAQSSVRLILSSQEILVTELAPKGRSRDLPHGRVGVGEPLTLREAHAEQEQPQCPKLPVCQKPELSPHSENQSRLLHVCIFRDAAKST